MRIPRKSFLHSMSAAAAIVLSGSCISVQAGQIPGDPNGWNRDNVNVRIYEADGVTLVDSVVWPDIDYSLIPADGVYESDIYDMSFINGSSGETLMATLVAKNPPVGIPPGLKVLNDQVVEPSQPESCIMATAVGITCGSGFQTHKRFKVLMQPFMVDGGTDSVDLVFDASNIGDPVEEYRVFQKINNWTGQRLTGFVLEVGTGTGANFRNALLDLTAANLSVEVDQYFTDPNRKTNFAHGLFGPIEPPNWGDTGAFTGGFFDDQSRAGYRITEVDTATFMSVPDGTTGGIFGKYEDVLPDDPNSPAGLAGFGQFGPWVPTTFLPQGVFFDDDDNPNTDDTLMAWWGYNTNCSTAPSPVRTNNYCWMYGDSDYYTWIDGQDPAIGFVKDNITTNYQPVSQATFTAWGIDSRYYVDTVDDLANLNLNYVVNVGTVDATWPTWDVNTSTATFTIRVTPKQDVNVANRTAAPGYNSTPHIPLSNPSSVGTVDIRPSPEFVPGTDTLTLIVADADLNFDQNTAQTITVVVDNVTTNETEDPVALTETGVNTGVFEGTLPTATGAVGVNNDGTIHAEPLEFVQVTYVDAAPAAVLTASTQAVAGYDGTVQFTAPVIPNGNILMQVDDLDETGPEITVTVVNQATAESEDVKLFQSLIAGQYIGSLASTDVPGSADDNGTMSVAVGDILQVTYTDAIARDGSVNVPRTDTVTVTAAPVVGGGGGGGCTLAISGNSNVTLPGLLLMILGLGWLRRSRRSGSD